jgi:hypothetical protein
MRRPLAAGVTMLAMLSAGTLALEACQGGSATTTPEGGSADGGRSEAGGCGLWGQPCCENASCGPELVCRSGDCREPLSDGRVDARDASSERAVDAGDADVAAPVYGDFLDASAWSTFDAIPPFEGGMPQFCGGTFDGRFVYMAPDGSELARYDTSMTFDLPAAWSTYSLDQVGEIKNFGAGGGGAVFDGRYVLFPPQNSFAIRYDTLAPFTTAGSWSWFDTTALNALDTGFAGGVFDGRYLYFVPRTSRTVRYDTTAPFEAAASWSDFDTNRLGSALNNYRTGLFDGRYVYYLPAESLEPTVLRFDTHADFQSTAAWAFFAVPGSDLGIDGFGGAFDGRYVYVFASSASGVTIRYDTKAPFTASSSWETSGITQLAAGGAFDGRYVYAVPGADGETFLRYDTAADFSADASWEAFGGLTLSAFCGAVFDGQFVYYVPNVDYYSGSYSRAVARFDAKTPPSLPKGYSGSFF